MNSTYCMVGKVVMLGKIEIGEHKKEEKGYWEEILIT